MSIMKNLFLLLILLFVTSMLEAQHDVWEKWDEDVIRKANTAIDIEYMNEEEKKVVLFINLARTDGDRFAETFLTQYLSENGTEKTGYVRSLFRDLKKVSELPLLIPEKDLTSIAQGHATLSGKTGHTGHRDFNKRFDPVMGNPYRHVGENCSYGYNRAIDIVITLLIDEGIRDMGHRKNMLNADFNSVGVAIRPHTRYRINCVIDFGSQVRSELNSNPY